MKRRRGGQPGNRNALKHGFYSRYLSHEEILSLQEAESLQGLDSEIPILRLKFGQLLDRDPDNLNLMLHASTALGRLLRLKNQLNPQQVKGLEQAVGDVMREIALPLGLNASHIFSPSEVANSSLIVEDSAEERCLKCHSAERGDEESGGGTNA